MEPPPGTVGRSFVYIVRRTDGKFYAGETDDLKSTALYKNNLDASPQTRFDSTGRPD